MTTMATTAGVAVRVKTTMATVAGAAGAVATATKTAVMMIDRDGVTTA